MESTSFASLLRSLSEYAANMNVILVIIFICSIIGVAVFIERLTYLKKIEIDTSSLIIRLRQILEESNLVDALDACEKEKGAVSNIIKAGLSKHTRPRDQIENAMEMRGLIEIAKMEKNARILSVIAHTAPLIGLLGTVLGFIKAFGEMRLSSLVEISGHQIGAAMEYALVTTAAGLVVAIPAVIAYNYIISRIEAMIVDIQVTSSEVVDLLINRQEKYR